jgi:hypothetical protein
MAKLKKERERELERLPGFLKDVAWAANHYGLPFTPVEPQERNLELMEGCDRFAGLIERRGKTTDEALAMVREDFDEAPKLKDMTPNWDQVSEIIKAGFADLGKDEHFWWVERGSYDMFKSMRNIIKGVSIRDTADYEPAPAYQKAA